MAIPENFRPKILGFLCNWCSYAGADLCGTSRYQYPPSLRIIRMMCSGRMDLDFVLRALSNGNDGVFIGGCWLGECHYVTEGNYDALSVLHLAKKLLAKVGINPARIRLEWVSASQGNRFAEVVTEFTNELTTLGPLGEGEGIDPATLKLKLDAVARLLPYIKLVEREKIRVRFENKEEYAEFFDSPALNALFDTTIADKLAISQILGLLHERQRSTREIADTLNMPISEVTERLKDSSRQKLVRFDEAEKCYALA
ncbi:MAG: hydrogenase iron-sulfur subunit [Gammaproteobacteria bacterium]|nr:hydrogenase iron-sulfur subunit [Gammaproteobacteria bacterium]